MTIDIISKMPLILIYSKTCIGNWFEETWKPKPFLHLPEPTVTESSFQSYDDPKTR